MPRPKNREELLKFIQENYDKLLALIDAYNDEQRIKEFPVGLLNRNIRDVIAHVHHWHVMLLSWYNEGQKGGEPDMPAKGHTWKTLPDLNLEINKRYTDMSLEEAKELFAESFARIYEVISNHTNEELFEKKRYSWTGSASMGAYFVSNTSSHYDWAYKLIKKSIK